MISIERSNFKFNSFKRYYQLYLLVLPALIYILLFHYGPMYGVIISFKDYSPNLGVFGSPWVGVKHFKRFLELPTFWVLVKNTLGISIYQLVAGFPLPIILAVMMNETRNRIFRNSVQMITYAPHFISTVALCGMVTLFLNQDTGIMNLIIGMFGGDVINFMSEDGWFKTIYVFSGIWQNTGWGTVIYFAALSSVDIECIEAAKIDGVTRLQKIWYIDLPGIAPTIIILLILNVGQLFSVGFEKVLLLQNPLNMEASDVIATYVYRVGLVGAQYSYTSAIGLFNSLLNCILLFLFNHISGKFSETSLW